MTDHNPHCAGCPDCQPENYPWECAWADLRDAAKRFAGECRTSEEFHRELYNLLETVEVAADRVPQPVARS